MNLSDFEKHINPVDLWEGFSYYRLSVVIAKIPDRLIRDLQLTFAQTPIVDAYNKKSADVPAREARLFFDSVCKGRFCV